MKKAEFALVITTIAPSEHVILKKFAKNQNERQFDFFIIGDKKTPAAFHLEGANYFSLKDQLDLDFSLSQFLPQNHYSRKNLGYLLAISNGNNVIVETDDDNSPLPEFWQDRTIEAKGIFIENEGWTNTYQFFTSKKIWPRGFPLEAVNDQSQNLDRQERFLSSPIQQGLANGDPDVDAIFRMTCDLPVNFVDHPPVILSAFNWCPFNSQNTTWFKDAFPLMYLPSYCSFRMTDIWRSFVAQRILWTCGHHLQFHQATVFQDRNDHSFIKDFEQEIPGYLHNHKIITELTNLDLKSGKNAMLDNLISCYKCLIENCGVIDKGEYQLLEAWCSDISRFI